MKFRLLVFMTDGTVQLTDEKRVQFDYPLVKCVSNHCTSIAKRGIPIHVTDLNDPSFADHALLLYRYDEDLPCKWFVVASVHFGGFKLFRKNIRAMSEEII